MSSPLPTAISLAKMVMRPISPASSCLRESVDSICCLGTMRMCVGACGFVSSKAYNSGVSATLRDGMEPAAILQKIQFMEVIVHYRAGRGKSGGCSQPNHRSLRERAGWWGRLQGRFANRPLFVPLPRRDYRLRRGEAVTPDSTPRPLATPLVRGAWESLFPQVARAGNVSGAFIVVPIPSASSG